MRLKQKKDASKIGEESKVSWRKALPQILWLSQKRINQKAPERGTFRRFVGLIAKYKWQMGLIAIATVIIALLNVWVPTFWARLLTP